MLVKQIFAILSKMDLLESNGLKSLGLKSRGFYSVKCKFCEKVFSSKGAESMCARHERTHTEEKPFQFQKPF
jgi:hypothetical protein